MPKARNGYKVYGADGCQITPEAAEKVLAAMEKTDCFDGVKLADYDAAAAMPLAARTRAASRAKRSPLTRLSWAMATDLGRSVALR